MESYQRGKGKGLSTLIIIPIMDKHQNLWENCKQGKLREAKQVLEAGADPNTTGERNMTCLMVAVKENHNQVVTLLLAQPDIQVNSSLRFVFGLAWQWHPGERQGQEQLHSLALGVSNGQQGQPDQPAGCSWSPAE